MTTGFATWIWDVLCLANGATGISLSNEKKDISITLNSEAYLKGLETIQKMELVDKSYVHTMKQDSAFQSGKVAMIAERPWLAVGAFDLHKTGSFDIGWVPLPKGPNVKGEVAPAIVEAWGVPVGAVNPKGGMAWVYYGSIFEADQIATNDPVYFESFNKTWKADQYEAYMEYMKRSTLVCSFINGVGDWYPNKRNGLWMEIFETGTPPATAVEKHKAELQYEISQILKK